jgi:predicted Na+-dependent transporter
VRVLKVLANNWMLPGIGLACLTGYLFPGAGDFLGRYLAAMIAVLMLMMGAGIGYRRFRSRTTAWRQVVFVMGLSFVVAPLLSWIIARAFFSNNHQLFTGLILNGATCTTLSTCVIFTRLAGGDEALALWLSVSSSLLGAVITPFILYIQLGSALSVPVALLIRKLMIVLFLPLSAGMLLRAVMGEQRVAPLGNFLTRSCSIIVLAVIMVAVSKGRSVIAGPEGLKILAAVSAFHLAMILAWRLAVAVTGFNPLERIATLFCSVEKTLQIPAYLAISVLGTPAAAVAPVVHHVVELVADLLLVSYFSSRNKHYAAKSPKGNQ